MPYSRNICWLCEKKLTDENRKIFRIRPFGKIEKEELYYLCLECFDERKETDSGFGHIYPDTGGAGSGMNCSCGKPSAGVITIETNNKSYIRVDYYCEQHLQRAKDRIDEA